eukprot:Hpha_TRINITY_DN13086_c0_g1::TRINITY_DN13086_c0_g1_i1::g.68777::m.68777
MPGTVGYSADNSSGFPRWPKPHPGGGKTGLYAPRGLRPVQHQRQPPIAPHPTPGRHPTPVGGSTHHRPTTPRNAPRPTTPRNTGYSARVLPAPTIEPESGQYLPEGVVTIHPPPEAPDAVLWFTTDGSPPDPLLCALRYSGPIPLQMLSTHGTLVVRAACTPRLHSGALSSEAVAVYTRMAGDQLLPPRWSVYDGDRLSGLDTITITARKGATIYFTTDGTDPMQKAQLYRGPFRLGHITGMRYDSVITLTAVAVADNCRPSLPSTVRPFLCAPPPPPQPPVRVPSARDPAPVSPQSNRQFLAPVPTIIPAPEVRILSDHSCNRVLISAHVRPPGVKVLYWITLDKGQPTAPAATDGPEYFPTPGPLPIEAHPDGAVLIDLVAEGEDGSRSHATHVVVAPLFTKVETKVERPVTPPRQQPRVFDIIEPDLELLARAEAAFRDFSSLYRTLSGAHADIPGAIASGASRVLMVGAEHLHGSCVLVVCCLTARSEEGIELPGDPPERPLSPINTRHFREAGDVLHDVYFELLAVQRLAKRGGAAADAAGAVALAQSVGRACAEACAAVREVAARLRSVGSVVSYADKATVTDTLVNEPPPPPPPPPPRDTRLEDLLHALMAAAASAEAACRNESDEGRRRVLCAAGASALSEICSRAAPTPPEAADAAVFFSRLRGMLDGGHISPPRTVSVQAYPPPPTGGHIVFPL